MNMAEHSQGIIEIINESFLQQEEKQMLAAQFREQGADRVFFTHMNELLANELKKRSDIYQHIVDEFDVRYNGIEDAYKSKHGELDADLEKRLSIIDMIDLSAKEKVFDHYYQDIGIAQADYEKQARELFAHLSSSVMRQM